MGKNVLVIVIDALSKWYIDECRQKGSFFENIQKNSYCANHMYATGPFTEAAVRGFWTSDEPLVGKSYLSEAEFNKPTIFKLFSDNHYYIYMGELTPFFNDLSIVNNEMKRERCEIRGFEHEWTARLSFYINIYKEKKFLERDYWKIEYLLDQYFNNYKEASNVVKEKLKYFKDKREYIDDILSKEERSSFFISQDKTLFYSCNFKNTVNYNNQKKHKMVSEELVFLNLVREKNTEFLYEMNKKFDVDKFIENELSGTRNRCINSNNNLISHMRDQNERLPKLKEELSDFLSWYDTQGEGMNQPFFAYIHNYDFHYPENFMNSRYDDFDAYICEIREKINTLEKLQCKKMSVSKQLSILNIDDCLKRFWRELEKRDVFRDTYVILTSDHGISNFMYPIDKKKERWNYTKMNFQVPFYLCGNDITKREDNDLANTMQILPTLAGLCELEGRENYHENSLLEESKEHEKERKYALWINGVPDLDRQRVKLGVRNKKYSITFEAYITQFIASANILGIYNLEEDLDETINLEFSKIHDKEFDLLYEYAKEIWFENILKIMIDDVMPYNFSGRYSQIIEKREKFDYLNKTLEKLSYEDLKSYIRNKKIIFFGAGEQFREFINQYDIQEEIIAIWDNDVKKIGTYILGHFICAPQEKMVTEDTVIIITSRDEMNIVNQLYEMNINRFYLSGAIY